LQVFYTQLVLLVRRLYQDCRLVHADLSEYNILVHQARPWSPTRVFLLTCEAHFNGSALLPSQLLSCSSR